MKGWRRRSLISIRFAGFFCRQCMRKLCASFDSLIFSGSFNSLFTIFTSSSSLFILKGSSPNSISNRITPSAQISIFSSYSSPLRISGLTYRGVPQKVVRRLLPTCTDQPKSQILSTPYMTSKLYLVDDDIFWLQISMNDVFGVHST